MAVDTTNEQQRTAQTEPHAFVSSDETWSICKVCGLGLGRSVHTRFIQEEPPVPLAYYGDDNPEVFD